MPLKAKLSDVRTTLSHRRTVRKAQRQLTAELGAFASAADRVELEQILDRHAAEETREIRTILARQDVTLAVTARRR